MAFLSDVIRLVANLCSYAWPAWPIKMTILHRLLIALKRLMEHIDVDVSINSCKKSFWCGFGKKINNRVVIYENFSRVGFSTCIQLCWIFQNESSTVKNLLLTVKSFYWRNAWAVLSNLFIGGMHGQYLYFFLVFTFGAPT